ncbi:hypothetical protein CL3_06020 [butyrate-producing bacterium SM4/1]|nr:hypothetical protein CLS_32030 [[Clostridium] cf. saccharolyticum K10]CBL35718.1 hypothetical protein CL3_06020 [butyrate-producing bacterium SM4/1]
MKAFLAFMMAENGETL